MISIQEELKKYEKKSIEYDNNSINDISDILTFVEGKINNIDKTSKKNYLVLETIKEELDEKNEQLINLKNLVKDDGKREEKLVKRIISILDHIDNIYRFAVSTQNIDLINNMDTSLKVIRKELREIGLEEISGVNEIFNPESHECVQAVEDSTKQKYEIIDVIKKGYQYCGQVVRVALVVANKWLF